MVTTAAVAPPVQATAPAGPPLDKATIIDPLATGGSYNLGARPGPSFQEVALKYGTDKVTNHRYQFMYEKYLNPLQGRKLKMLEIGLGCNMVSRRVLFHHPLLFYGTSRPSTRHRAEETVVA